MGKEMATARQENEDRKSQFETGSIQCPHCGGQHPGFMSRCPETHEPIGKAGRDKKERMATGSFVCPHCNQVHPGFINRCPEKGLAVDRAFKMGGEILDGKYRVGRFIAKGGMGVVFEGVQENLGRKVAIKFLLAEYQASHQLVTRFQNEARLAASVGHRNIVDILDMGATPGGVHYIVMEYLDGRDLGEILESSFRLSQPVAVGFALQVLSALRAVHEQGIIHRDLKPENVFIVPEPGGGMSVKILDFGISRLGGNDTRNINLTMTGAVFGTPGYMAPEQARGSRTVDRRTDLYACGVILYEMLTGVLPFEGDNYNNMIIALTTEDPVPVGNHGVPLPEGLQDVVMRAISRDPDDRYASAGELFDALQPFRIADAALPVHSRSTMDAVDRSHSGRYSHLGLGTPREQELVATVRPRPGPRQDAPSGDMVIRLDTPVKPGDTPRPEPGQGGWHEPHAGTGPVLPVPVNQASGSPLSLPPDTSISLNGWVGPASLPPPRSGRRVPGWLLVSAAAVLLLALTGTATFLVIKARDLEHQVGAVQAADASPVARISPQPATPEPGVHALALEGLPEGAEVYVDGTLHPERPLIVEESADPRMLRIVAPGYETWVEQVAVTSDTSLEIQLTEVPGDVELDRKKSRKKSPGAKAKSRIDTSYPGLM
jgi:serine/threonine-protein kinase